MSIVYGAVPAQAENLKFMLVNDTKSTIVGFYVSHPGSKKRKKNYLKDETLPADYEIDIKVRD
jgi:hypothetical protein